MTATDIGSKLARTIVVGLVIVAATALVPTVAAEPATVNASGPSSAAPGETVTVSVTLTNSGQNDSGYIVEISVPDNWTVTSHTNDGGVWNEDDRSWLWQTISPGDLVTPAVTVEIPSDETGGSYTIEAVAKSSDGIEGTTTQTVTVESRTENSGTDTEQDTDSANNDGTASTDAEPDNSTVEDATNSTEEMAAGDTETNETGDDENSTEDGETVDSTETESETPGFGAIVAVVALGGVALAAGRRN